MPGYNPSECFEDLLDEYLELKKVNKIRAMRIQWTFLIKRFSFVIPTPIWTKVQGFSQQWCEGIVTWYFLQLFAKHLIYWEASLVEPLKISRVGIDGSYLAVCEPTYKS